MKINPWHERRKKIHMNPQTPQQLDQKTIETLKAARNQVMQADKSRVENMNLSRGQNPSPKPAHDRFAEDFVQKMASIEREKATVDEEMAKTEKLLSSLVEKKKQLEARSNELAKVKDKLRELDKEMNSVLKSQQL